MVLEEDKNTFVVIKLLDAPMFAGFGVYLLFDYWHIFE